MTSRKHTSAGVTKSVTVDVVLMLVLSMAVLGIVTTSPLIVSSFAPEPQFARGSRNYEVPRQHLPLHQTGVMSSPSDTISSHSTTTSIRRRASSSLHLSQSTSTLDKKSNTSPPSRSVPSSSVCIEPEPEQEQESREPLPYAAETIDGRLLCSSECAYEIRSPYFRGSSYRPNTTARRITRGANSVLIGHTTDGITIAFRGTQTTSLLDWLQNAALFLSDVDEKKYKIQGKIHTGFYRGTKSLWKPLKGILKDMLVEAGENGWSQEVYLTGHSKGGAMASIASILLKRDTALPDPAYVCTFASARVGDSQFRDAYNERINQTSYEAHLDLIPFLPPSVDIMESMNPQMSEMIEGVLWSETSLSKKDNYKWDYQTLGNRKYINEQGEIIHEVTKELDKLRIAEIEEKTTVSWDELTQSHCSGCLSDGCGGRYFSAVASDVCSLCVQDE